MRSLALVVFLGISILGGCSTFRDLMGAPAPDGTITHELPGGGSITVTAPETPTEPVEVPLPGGGKVVLQPAPPPTTGGGVAANIVGAITGLIGGHPILATVGAALVNGLVAGVGSSLHSKPT